MRALPVVVLALLATLSGAAVAEESPLAGVMVHPWSLQLSASRPKEVPKEYLVIVEAPAGANLPLGKAYYGVFVSDPRHAALIVDLTPAVVVESDDKVIIDPNAIPGRRYAKVRFKKVKPGKFALLALSLETKPLPLSLPVKMVKPEGLELKVGRVNVKLTREVAEDLARVLATYEYGLHRRVDVGYLQALVFKVLIREQLVSSVPSEPEKLETRPGTKETERKETEQKEAKRTETAETATSTTAEATAEATTRKATTKTTRTEAKKTETETATTEKTATTAKTAAETKAETEEKKVNEETGYALRAFLEVNGGRSTDVRAEFEATNLERLIGEAASLVEDFLKSPEGQKLVGAAERTARAGAAAAPVAAAAVLAGLLAPARVRRH